MLIRPHEVAQTVHHEREDVGGNDAVTQQCLSPLCPHRCHLFASSPWHANLGCLLEAIDTPRGYVRPTEVKEEDTVGLWPSSCRLGVGQSKVPYDAWSICA